MKYFYATSFNSELYSTKKVVKEILKFLQQNLPTITTDELYEVRLIFSELLCNAVIHGNKLDLEKKVFVEVELADVNISATVTDEGNGFNYMNLLYESDPIESLSKDHGRGIFLVSSLTDSLRFNIEGNQIKFHKKVNLNAQNYCSG